MVEGIAGAWPLLELRSLQFADSILEPGINIPTISKWSHPVSHMLYLLS